MEKPNFKIASKEEVYWNNELRVAMMQIDSIKQEVENHKNMILLLENTIEFCKKQLKNIHDKGGTKT